MGRVKNERERERPSSFLEGAPLRELERAVQSLEVACKSRKLSRGRHEGEGGQAWDLDVGLL